MSRHHVLELLDIIGVAAANGSANLEIAIFDTILALCYLWRDA